MKKIFLSINSDPSVSANLLTHRCLRLPVKQKSHGFEKGDHRLR